MTENHSNSEQNEKKTMFLKKTYLKDEMALLITSKVCYYLFLDQDYILNAQSSHVPEY